MVACPQIPLVTRDSGPCLHSSLLFLIGHILSEVLTALYQVVTIGTAPSERLQVASGVPQGSILGPLLFSIYMNDLPSVPQHCFVQYYVADTKLLLSFRLQDQSRIVAEKNQDLKRIRNWCFNTQLLLNPDKTSKHGVAKTHKFKLSFLGKQLAPVDAARDKTDASLTFDDHDCFCN